MNKTKAMIHRYGAAAIIMYEMSPRHALGEAHCTGAYTLRSTSKYFLTKYFEVLRICNTKVLITCTDVYTSRVREMSAAVTGRPRHTTCTIFPCGLLVGTMRPVGVSTSRRRPREQHWETSSLQFSFVVCIVPFDDVTKMYA